MEFRGRSVRGIPLFLVNSSLFARGSPLTEVYNREVSDSVNRGCPGATDPHGFGVSHGGREGTEEEEFTEKEAKTRRIDGRRVLKGDRSCAISAMFWGNLLCWRSSICAWNKSFPGSLNHNFRAPRIHTDWEFHTEARRTRRRKLTECRGTGRAGGEGWFKQKGGEVRKGGPRRGVPQVRTEPSWRAADAAIMASFCRDLLWWPGGFCVIRARKQRRDAAATMPLWRDAADGRVRPLASPTAEPRLLLLRRNVKERHELELVVGCGDLNNTAALTG
jgi:hypothetical protein